MFHFSQDWIGFSATRQVLSEGPQSGRFPHAHDELLELLTLPSSLRSGFGLDDNPCSEEPRLQTIQERFPMLIFENVNRFILI